MNNHNVKVETVIASESVAISSSDSIVNMRLPRSARNDVYHSAVNCGLSLRANL